MLEKNTSDVLVLGKMMALPVHTSTAAASPSFDRSRERWMADSGRFVGYS